MHNESADINSESVAWLADMLQGGLSAAELQHRAALTGWRTVLRDLDVHDFRVCSECGALMHEGYCVSMGLAYYCSDKCLHRHFTDEEWEKECRTDGQSYWTDWYEHYGMRRARLRQAGTNGRTEPQD